MIERAVPPVLPVSPNPTQIFGVCLVAGLVLFVGPILARGFLRPLISSEAGLRQLAGVNLLISIPRIETPENARLNRLRWVKNFGFSATSAASFGRRRIARTSRSRSLEGRHPTGPDEKPA